MEVWSTHRQMLNRLKDMASTFPQLSSAVGSIMSFLDVLEMAVGNLQDEDLVTELTMLNQSLKEYTSGPPKEPSNSMMGIAMAIEREAADIAERLERARGRDIREPSTNEAGLIGSYRNIHSHFRKLHADASMGAWSTEDEHAANARVESLNPTTQAAYDSTLSIEINRRCCTEGTRKGVFDGLEKWLFSSTSSSIYWMNGMAGTGKTTIACTFCERVERYKLLAASFFCTRISSECRKVAQIVPTIAYQLARYSTAFLSALCQVLRQNPDIGSKNILKQFELLIKEPLGQVRSAMPNNLVVVIDALDECDDYNGVGLVVDVILRHAGDMPLKFLITSRPEPEIHTKMSMYGQSREVLHLHEIEKSLVRTDIELYLKQELGFMSPSQAEVEELANHSGALFIYAATLVRYICGKRSTDPKKRLRAVLEKAPESTKKHTQIDALYATILESALREDALQADETEDTRAVLRVVLLAQEPLSVMMIAQLIIIDDARVVHALQSLRSVLHQSATGLVSTLHASFPDFMFNKQRSKTYYCDILEHSQSLALRCFSVMQEQLRFNICHLDSSFVPNTQVVNLPERVKEWIPATLAYACRYWASHLSQASISEKLLATLEDFLSNLLLFWMEVLSLRHELPVGVDGLLKIQQWLIRTGPTLSELALFVDDARSFMTGFAVNPVSQSTPHIYVSSLAFCPQSSSVHKHYGKRARGLLKLKGSLIECREAAPLVIWTVGSEIISLALSPDGTRVVIGCLDKTVSILSAYDGTIYVGPLQGHSKAVNAVAFSPDGGRVASASLGGIRVWNAYNGTLIAGPFKGHVRFINSVAFSPDGSLIVSGGHDFTIRVWNAYDGTQTLGPLSDHADLVLCVAFSPDGSLIASSSANHTIRLRDSRSGTPVAPPLSGHTGRVNSLVFTPAGNQLIGGSSDGIRIWTIPDGSIVTSSFEGFSGGVNALAVSPDGTRIAAGCHDHAVRVWSIDDGKFVAGPFFGHTDSIKSIAYFPDGSRVISGSPDRTIHVWNVRDGMLLPPPLPPQNAVVAIENVTFCPDNLHFLSSDRFGVIRIWDTSNASFITAPDKGVFFPTSLSSLSPDRCYIASNSEDDELQIMSTATGSRIAGPFKIEHASLSTFGFSHDNKAIIMGCSDGTIKVCELQSGNVAIGSFEGHLKGVRSLTESPDCSLLVSYSDYDSAIRVWSIVAPALDLKLFSNHALNPNWEYAYPAVYDGWNIREDGWVVNNSGHFLFWLPPSVASAWCSPYAILVITKSGTLQVPKQKPFVGDQWARCYISE